MPSYLPAGKLMLIWQDFKVGLLNKLAKNCCCEFGTEGILGVPVTSIERLSITLTADGKRQRQLLIFRSFLLIRK